MKKTLIVGAVAGLAIMTACTDHEVIPPPVPLVDLDCQCDGTITNQNGDTSFTYNDTCTYSSTKTINTGSLSEAQYNAQFQNLAMTGGFELEMRSLYWNDQGQNNPTSSDWQAYFEGNLNPGYAPTTLEDGAVLKWTDPNGRVWTSDTSTICLSNFTFNLFTYDSDTTGEYMEFDAVAHGTLWNSDITVDSSICFSNLHLKSAFRRE